MPTPTYTALAEVTLGGTDSEVVFSSIPATFRDLVVVVNSRASTTGVEGQLRLNGDTGNSYSWVRMTGNGSTTASTSGTLTHMPLADAVKATTTQACLILVQLIDYSATDKHKSILVRNNSADTAVEAFAGRWANTGAVTSVTIKTNTGSWAAGGTFALYGIAS